MQTRLLRELKEGKSALRYVNVNPNLMPVPTSSTHCSGLIGGLVLGALTLAGCANITGLLSAPEVKPNADLQFERQPSGDYLLTVNSAGQQPIYLGTRTSNIDWSEPYGQRQGKKTFIKNPGPADRYFLGMLASNGDTLIVSDKRLPLSGSNNFRDIGGIPTRDGRFVRWGQIYRSDRLSALTKEDQAYLASLGLKTVIDFRSEAEIAKDPDRLPEGAEYLQAPIIFDVEDTTQLRERIIGGEISVDEASDILVEGNRLFATDMASRFQPFIDCVLENKGPLVYHCTSGKDRTGFATMLMLSALNVGRDTIVEDYLLSNYYRYEMNSKRLNKLRYAGIVKPRLDLGTLAPLMIVDRRYINAAYDAIEEKYGDVNAFLEAEYGLTPEKRAELIDLYTYGPAITIDGEFVPDAEGDLELPEDGEMNKEVKAAPTDTTTLESNTMPAEVIEVKPTRTQETTTKVSSPNEPSAKKAATIVTTAPKEKE